MKVEKKKYEAAAVTVMLTVGAFAILLLVLSLLSSVLDSGSPSWDYEIAVDRDGTVTQTSSGGREEPVSVVYRPDGTVTRTSSGGRAARVLDIRRRSDGLRSSSATKASLVSAAFLQAEEVLPERFETPPWSRRVVEVRAWYGKEVSLLPTRWYFLHDGRLEGRGYFVGYDKKTNLVTGYIGRNGACGHVPAAEEQFPIDGRKMLDGRIGRIGDHLGLQIDDCGVFTVISADDGLAFVDFDVQTVKYPWRGKLVSDAWYGGMGAMSFLLRTPDRVCAIDRDGKERKSWSIPESLRNIDLKWHVLADGGVVAIHSFGAAEEAFWLDSHGKIVRRETIPGRPSPRDQAVVQCGIAVLPPLVVAACTGAEVSAKAGREGAGGYAAALSKIWAEFGAAMLGSLALAIVLAYQCRRRHQAFGLSHTWLAVTFVLLCGLPGYLGYRFHRAWPARLPCPQCGRRVPHDRTTCLVCRHEFPAPSLRGTEIFAS